MERQVNIFTKNDFNDSDIPSIENTSEIDTSHMDKGWAWVVVMSGTLNYLVLFGTFNAFGLFQEYFLNTLFVNESATSISWIGTMTSTYMLGSGLIAGPIMAKIGIRWATLLGCALSSAGLLCASFSTKIWHFAIFQGIVYGTGGSIIINITLVMPSLWFRKSKNTAIAIISSGSGFGTLVIGPIIQFTLKNYGIRWPIKSFKPLQNFLDFQLLKRPLTLFLCIGGFFAEWGYIIPPFYFPASVRSIGQSRATASNTILAFAATSGVSRLSSGFMATKFGATKVLIIAMISSGVLILALWLPTKSFSVYYTFFVLYGFFCPLFFPLCPVIIAKNYPDNEISMTNGIVYAFYGLSAFFGVPITGLLFDRIGNKSNYTPVIINAGLVFLISGAILMAELEAYPVLLETISSMQKKFN
ncbi:hypothetical protein BB561_002232 [Smittium simulii]|uniref:Major facilitator superfamily (MFS) profile domain-containing protein n=1 Tax=Smittium simulii TaxID=133385 RepID=A0A2T9YR51_9FUNG|nr:hypothetical protein BB561_002232 [Smittium simulii]